MISAAGRYPATDNSSCRLKATRTGAVAACASLIATIVSAPSAPFDPNPPPMCSATTRTLSGVELEMLGDLRLEFEHELRRDMHGQPIAVEAGDARHGAPDRCAAGFRSGTSLRTARDRPRVRALAIQPRADFFFCENAADGPADIAGPRRPRGRAFAGVGLLPLSAGKQHRRARLCAPRPPRSRSAAARTRP